MSANALMTAVARKPISIHVYACMHVRMYACTHVRMYACMHGCMDACMHGISTSLHSGVSYILKAQRGFHIVTLGSNFLLTSYTDSLGVDSIRARRTFRSQERVFCVLWTEVAKVTTRSYPIVSSPLAYYQLLQYFGGFKTGARFPPSILGLLYGFACGCYRVAADGTNLH